MAERIELFALPATDAKAHLAVQDERAAGVRAVTGAEWCWRTTQACRALSRTSR